MQRRTCFIFLVLLGLGTSTLWAHPVSYQNALSLMTWNQPYVNDTWVTYSYRPYGAVVARYMRMDMEDGAEMKLYLPQADFLLYRKNARHYQANVYAYGGYGVQDLDRVRSGAGVLGMEADAEDRKYYGSFAFQSILPTRGPTLYQTTVRAGIAPYVAEFQELGTWFIVQYQVNPQLRQRSDFTPLLRFMYRNILAETGVGVTHGDWLLNFMVHF
jgi:hypothetical protein